MALCVPESDVDADFKNVLDFTCLFLKFDPEKLAQYYVL